MFYRHEGDVAHVEEGWGCKNVKRNMGKEENDQR